MPKKPKLTKRNKFLIRLGIALLIASGIFGIMKFRDVFSEGSQPVEESQSDEESNNEQTTEDEEPAPEETSQAPQQSASVNGPIVGVGTVEWVVNKQRPLNPKTYVPPSLVFPGVKLRVPGNESMKIRSDVGSAMEKLFAAAKTAGHDPMLSSGYRSYSYQVSLYNSYVRSQGQAEADKQSARPGYSEHQTGMAFDICNAGNCQLAQSFANTGLGKWVADHAHEYGFIIRYLDGKQGVTGYIYEPWHLRYVGTDLAAKIKASGKTMEEYFGLPPAPTY